MGFSQHQSFYFRDKWLEKFFDYVSKNVENSDAFDISNYYKLGIGKNMFDSIKFWVKAFKITDNKYKLTDFGKAVLECDPILLNINSISLLHYNLVNNKEDAPFWFWFFNEFRSSFLVKEEVFKQDNLMGWAETNFKRVSPNSIKKDLLCFIQTYSATENKKDPEDSMFSPFSKLPLITETNLIISKNEVKYESIGQITLMYSLLDKLEEQKKISISVDELFELSGYWGRVFLLDKGNIIRALNDLKFKYKNILSFDQSSKIDLVTIRKTDKFSFLKKELGNYHGY
jgi:hypothetical protein